MFLHQTKNQQRLIKLFGNDICLLGATYQVVASFSLQDETTSAVKEALLILRSWNPFWQPKCFMVDNCEEEINSIGHVFLSKGNNACFRFIRRLLCFQFAKAYLVKFY